MLTDNVIERELWFDEETADGHFSIAAEFYDYIMGYFEILSNNAALDLLHDQNFKVIADIGAGTGLSVRSMINRFPRATKIVAIDKCPNMLRQAKKRIDKSKSKIHIEYLQLDAEHSMLPERSIDFIYSSYLLDHLTKNKRRNLLGEFGRILSDDGMICLVTMDGEPKGKMDSVLSNLYNMGYERWNPIWQKLFHGYAPHCRPIKLKQDLMDLGFQILKTRRTYVALFPVSIHIIKKGRG